MNTINTPEEIKHFNHERTPEFWALEHPYPGGPNDDNVKTYLKYKVEGSAETQLNNYFSSDYKNTSDLRVGAEYRVAGFRLRGG